MLHRTRLAAARVAFCFLILALAACSAPVEDTPEPEPVAETPEPVEPQGPFYELTKDDVTTNPDWTSSNITLYGVKLGDITNDHKDKFGTADAVEPVGDDYRTIYDKASYALYTHKYTGKLQKIEIYGRFAEKIKDAKLKRLLSGGSLDYMHETFGPDDGQDVNPNTTGIESVYNSKGFRFVQYELSGGVKVNSLLFLPVKTPTN